MAHEVLLWPGAYLPAAQSEHAADPVCEANFPAVQKLQPEACAPDCSPAGQGLQRPPLEYFPGVQATHVVSCALAVWPPGQDWHVPAPAAEIFPPVHEEQAAAAPAEYLPAEQEGQLWALVPEYRPAMQSEH